MWYNYHDVSFIILFFICQYMSEEKNLSKFYYSAVGVFKIDYKSAGYPDLMKIAKEWAQDSNFYELFVRGVSEKNFGIQFIYYMISDKELDEHPIKKYKNELKEKFGSGFYAWDYSSGNGKGDDHNHEVLEGLVVLKELNRA